VTLPKRFLLEGCDNCLFDPYNSIRDAILLAGRAPGLEHRTRETSEWLDQFEPELEKHRIYVIRRDLTTPTAYQEFLAEYWDKPTFLINLEHDVVPTLNAVIRLLNCPWPACTQAYELGGHVFTGPIHPDLKDPNWCDMTGFGLMKLAPLTRRQHPLPPMGTWEHLDYRYMYSIRKTEACFKWHTHPEIIKHNHPPET